MERIVTIHDHLMMMIRTIWSDQIDCNNIKIVEYDVIETQRKTAYRLLYGDEIINDYVDNYNNRLSYNYYGNSFNYPQFKGELGAMEQTVYRSIRDYIKNK